MLTLPQVARRLAVSPEKVNCWIRSGELRAIDVSSRPGVGRPRYRIDVADLIALEVQRQVIPQLKKAQRRRRKQPDVLEFF